MSIQINELPEDQVQRLLHLEEGHFLDLKDVRVAPAKLTQAISAFANSDGGELYVGSVKALVQQSGLGMALGTSRRQMATSKFLRSFFLSASSSNTNSSVPRKDIQRQQPVFLSASSSF